jgi:hypothetical protein
MLRRLFADMDLYKGIILMSCVLTPVAGYWAWSMNKQIRQGRIAGNNAIRRGGDLETIGTYQKQIENQVERAGRQMVGNYLTFFEQQVLSSVKDGGLRRDQIVIGAPADRPTGRGNTLDRTVTLEFKTGANVLELPREFINAVCFNVELASPAWKLRQLKMTNKDTRELRGKAPPPETGDQWRVDRLVFATREPRTPANR